MMELNIGFIVKFVILFIPLSVITFLMAPSIKWKLLFQPCIAIGIFLALSGYSLNPHKLRR